MLGKLPDISSKTGESIETYQHRPYSGLVEQIQ